MFSRIADQKVPIGTCNPAQARILVKQELASWVDGELQLLLRPVFLDVIQTNEHLMRGPFDDQNTSQAELDRRLQWFKMVMLRGSQALAGCGQPAERLGPRIQKQLQESWKTATLYAGPELTEEEAQEFFPVEEPGSSKLEYGSEEYWKLTVLWLEPGFYLDEGRIQWDLNYVPSKTTPEPGVYMGPGLSGNMDVLDVVAETLIERSESTDPSYSPLAIVNRDVIESPVEKKKIPSSPLFQSINVAGFTVDPWGEIVPVEPEKTKEPYAWSKVSSYFDEDKTPAESLEGLWDLPPEPEPVPEIGWTEVKADDRRTEKKCNPEDAPNP
jgi:hypothetical protein